eukprot:2445412-Pyramimonas_sp.AAC.1
MERRKRDSRCFNGYSYEQRQVGEQAPPPRTDISIYTLLPPAIGSRSGYIPSSRPRLVPAPGTAHLEGEGDGGAAE